jgi:putative GTP pyrophosphokinase
MPSLDFDTEKTEFQTYYRTEGDVLRSALSSFKGLVRALVASLRDIPMPVVTGRLKDCDEAIAKFESKYRSQLEASNTPYSIRNHATDLLGVRVICYYESNIQTIQELLQRNFNVLTVTDKNQELSENPNSFGYKGLHLDLKLSQNRRDLPEFDAVKDIRFELQLRTTVQHSWSEIEHKISYKKSVPNQLRHRIVRLSGLFELADQEFEAIRVETEAYAKDARQSAPSLSSNTQQPTATPLKAFHCEVVLETYFHEYRPNPYAVDIFMSGGCSTETQQAASLMAED